MIRGTTPTYTVQIVDGTTDNVEDICFAIEQPSTETKVIIHSKNGGRARMTLDGALFTLSEEETLSFTPSKTSDKTKLIKQVTVVYKDGTVRRSNIDELERESVYDAIHDEVHYGRD